MVEQPHDRRVSQKEVAARTLVLVKQSPVFVGLPRKGQDAWVETATGVNYGPAFKNGGCNNSSALENNSRDLIMGCSLICLSWVK